MAKKIIIATIDTETSDLPPKNYVYDVGLVIHDKKGRVLATYHALVQEVFTDGEQMMGAFFARKMFSHYAPMLNKGEIELKPWKTICDDVQSLVTQHNVSVIAAYNLKFDKGALKLTGDEFGSSLLPKRAGGYKMLDIWLFVCLTKLRQTSYRSLARALGWTTGKGNVKTSAEHAYRFISGKHGFDEDHTALSDAHIEVEILAECYRMKKAVPYGRLEHSPWKYAQS